MFNANILDKMKSIRVLPLLTLVAALITSCGKEEANSTKPAKDSQAAHWLDGSQKDLKTFVSSAQHRVINIGPKRMTKLLDVVYAGKPDGVFATMISEEGGTSAFAEQIIIKLPKEAAASASYVAAAKRFFKERGYPDETVQVDSGDKRFLVIDPNPGGSALTLKNEDDK